MSNEQDQDSASSSTSVLQRQEPNQDDTDNDICIEESPTKALRGKNRVYEELCTYETFNEFTKELIDSNIDDNNWTKKNKSMSSSGEKLGFKCSKCDKRLYIIKHREDAGVTVYIEDKIHLHTPKVHSIPTATRDKVIEMHVQDKKKPKDIMRWLRLHINDGFIELNAIQINNIIQRFKITTSGPAKMSVVDLKKWADEKSTIPDDVDKMFVISKFTIDPTDFDFNLFMTTRRLISLALHNDMIATDATHKLTWQDFQLLLCGTVDQTRAFHPFGVLLSRHERGEDYKFLFECIKEMTLQLFNFNYNPTVLLADAAMAITNGFKLVFTNLNKRIVCWAHVKRKLKEYLRGVDHKSLILTDIHTLQGGTSEKHFKVAVKLLARKWRSLNNLKINEFFEYFLSQWFGEYTIGWYERYSEGYPSTNNALESTNNRSRSNIPHYYSVQFEAKGFITGLDIRICLVLNVFPAVDIPVEGIRKKGRPKKAAPALTRNSVVPMFDFNINIQDNIIENQSMEFNVQQDLIENIQEIENRLQIQSPNIPLEFQVDTVLTSIDNQPAKKKRGRPKTVLRKI
ncbi:hypothetical protein BpHYR1_042175 [Brachionus plicatilis]|uniref:MULE transposase domain-containing protein n=1 Tax=Brachionus plicatilis TaxID=10195 RepID=A0A3M7SEZ4_BRAPC|nr:hypothetical protein BpHYR1_042175 [Brachionus plicatilis]